MSPLAYHHGNGISRVALGRAMDISSCDTRALLVNRGDTSSGKPEVSHVPYPQLDPDAYLIDWVVMAGSYDFMYVDWMDVHSIHLLS